MQAQDAERQIAQMIEFIKQEAKEKAEEINVKTEAEFNAKKLNKIVQARQELKEEYAQKKKEVASKKRIARSRLINNARFEQMRERDRILKELKASISEKLSEVAGHPKYAELVLSLIVQGLITILEDKVELKCRQADLSIVEKALPTALKQFKEIVKAEVGVEPQVEVTVNKSDFLPGPATKDNTGPSCAGGVSLSARHGKIVCHNTLDARFEQAYQELLPVTRAMIFGKRAAVKVAQKTEKAHH